MFDVNLKIISELKSFLIATIGDKVLMSVFSTSEKDFTRSRKLPFSKLVLLITKLCKKTLSVELESFFEESDGSSPCSVSAFSQQRIKLKPVFFSYWNTVLTNSFYCYSRKAVKRWKGYRVIGADGSNVCLTNNKVLNEYFGGQSNQNCFFVQAKTFYHYDVLNELIILSEMRPYRHGEMKMAQSALNYIEEDMLTIYDRYYGTYKMIALHLWQEKERKFVIRANENQKWIKEFIAGGKQSSLVSIGPSVASIKGLKTSGFNVTKETFITIRLVRIQLDKSIGVIITNLWEEEGHQACEFKDVYHMRWGVETNISIQKNILQLESFSGLTVESVLQDFYATVFTTNLHAVIIKDAQLTVEHTIRKRKYPVKINKNKSFGKLKSKLIKLFINQEPEIILKLLYDSFVMEVIPIRKGRSFPRIRKNPQSKSKFKTYPNFKPAY